MQNLSPQKAHLQTNVKYILGAKIGAKKIHPKRVYWISIPFKTH